MTTKAERGNMRGARSFAYDVSGFFEDLDSSKSKLSAVQAEKERSRHLDIKEPDFLIRHVKDSGLEKENAAQGDHETKGESVLTRTLKETNPPPRRNKDGSLPPIHFLF